jgi:hypothetical protein
MKLRPFLCAALYVATILSCKKDRGTTDPGTISQPPITKKILLKDITIPLLPSPYYHFEYGADSLVSKVDFGSGFTIHDVLYDGGKVKEMRNNIFVNHDTLRYSYNNAGKVSVVTFINEDNIRYRHAVFTYSGDQLAKIEWDHKTANGSFSTDRVLTFFYFPDGNLKEMRQHRFLAGSPGSDYTTHFSNYDNKINVDDNTVIHDGIHDHFLLLPDLHIQKNNPGREWATGDSTLYTVNYTYTYNADNTPRVKSGDFVWTSGSSAGQHVATSTFYSYY